MIEEKTENRATLLNAFNNLVNKPETSIKIKKAWKTFCDTTKIEIPEEHYTEERVSQTTQSIQSKSQIEDLTVTDLNEIESIIYSEIPEYLHSFWDIFYKVLAPKIKSADSTEVEELEAKREARDK